MKTSRIIRGGLLFAAALALPIGVWILGPRSESGGASGMSPGVVATAPTVPGPAPAPVFADSAKVVARSKHAVRRPARRDRPRTPDRTLVPVEAGRVVALDPETGQFGSPSPEQAQALALGLDAQARRNQEDPVQVQLPNGAVSLYVEGRMDCYAVGRVDRNGRAVFGCVRGQDALRKALGDSTGVPQALEEQ